MSVKYGFYDSVEHDRLYNAQQMSALFDGVINDGVFMTVGGCFAVAPTTGMSIKVASGRAWFNSTWTYNDADLVLTVDNPDAAGDRIDAVVLEVDNSSSVRANTIKIVKGEAAAAPTKPLMVNSDYIHQYALAYITVDTTATEITATEIENVVGTSECPYVTGILQTASIDALVSQWQAQFENWLAFLTDELSENQAGNLQAQILEKVNLADKATTEEAVAGTSNSKWMTPKTTDDSIKALKTDGRLYSCGTTDLTAGTSELETGKLYFVYE